MKREKSTMKNASSFLNGLLEAFQEDGCSHQKYTVDDEEDRCCQKSNLLFCFRPFRPTDRRADRSSKQKQSSCKFKVASLQAALTNWSHTFKHFRQEYNLSILTLDKNHSIRSKGENQIKSRWRPSFFFELQGVSITVAVLYLF